MKNGIISRKIREKKDNLNSILLCEDYFQNISFLWKKYTYTYKKVTNTKNNYYLSLQKKVKENWNVKEISNFFFVASPKYKRWKSCFKSHKS